MKYLYSIAFLLLFSSASAQKLRFTNPNNIWHTTNYNSTGFCLSSYTSVYSYTGDTLIGSNHYSVLNESATCTHKIGLIREDTAANIIYIRINDTDRVLYNYNLQAGDTIHGYSISMSTSYIDSVTQVDSVMINGVYHKIISLKEIDTLNQDWGGVGLDFSYSYIEGLGSTYGPLHPFAQFDGEISETLNCAGTNDTTYPMKAPIVVWSYGHQHIDTFRNDCRLGVRSVYSQPVTLTTSPNPAADFIDLTLHGNKAEGAYILKIYDLLGKTIYESQVSTPLYHLDISHFQNGMYIVMAQWSDGSLQKQKLIISR